MTTDTDDPNVPGPYTPEIARACAHRGAEWLSFVYPDWANEMNLTVLDMQDPINCAFGQTGRRVLDSLVGPTPNLGRTIFGGSRGYDHYLEVLSAWGVFGSEDEHAWAKRHGFYIRLPATEDRTPERVTRWEMLKCAWVEEVTERRRTQSTAQGESRV